MGFNSVNDSLSHQENYGQGYYIGTVSANNDTVGIGRVQAHVDGLFDTQHGEVPYIGPLKDSPYGFGKGPKGPYGVYGMPQVGSTIKVELQNGDEHKGLYTTLITAQSAHPWFNTSSRWGFVDPQGNMLQVDFQAGSWVFTHQSGSFTSFDKDGNMIASSVKDMTALSVGKMTARSQDNMSATSLKRIDVQAPLITFNTEPVV